MIRFKEKVETLFLWGHQLEDLRGFPGFLAEPKEFSAGRRIFHSSPGEGMLRTQPPSRRAIWPFAVKTEVAWVFCTRWKNTFNQVTTRGEALAKALDERLRKRKSYESLIDLRLMHASEAEAKDLFCRLEGRFSRGCRAGSFQLKHFFKESTSEQADALGSRSAMICFIQEILKKSRRTLSLEEIRMH